MECFRAEFEPDDELEGLDVDIRPALYDKADDCDYPSVLNFMPPDEFREVMDQPRPHITEVAVAFPHHSNYKQLHDLVMLDKSKLFMANPPKATMSDNDMTAVQKWAIELGCDPKQQILYICGKAGSGKSTVALKICERLKGSVQAGAGTGKAASIFNGPTMHSMFGWSFEEFRDGDAYVNNARKLGILRTFYETTKCFIIDEVNALSAATLGQLHDTLSAIFSGPKTPNRPELPFGGCKMIFLGDPAQLKPPVGAAIYDVESSFDGPVRTFRGARQTILQRTAKGQELYRKYLVPNCVVLQRGQRNNGLLAQIMDKIRNGQQDEEDLTKLTFMRRRFPEVIEDTGIHYTNEACATYNARQLWNECRHEVPPKRMYICRASYHATNTNQSVIDGLSALSSKKFSFAPDTLFLSIGCKVRLVKNISVAAGLVNSSTGTVVAIIYDKADVQAVLDGKHPSPYCILVCFPNFHGFPVKGKPASAAMTPERQFPFPDDHTLVPIFRTEFRPSASDVPRWIFKTQDLKDCYRCQFPLDLATHITAHRAQGQTLENCIVSVDLDLNTSNKQIPVDIGSILYVACTRTTQLSNLFLGPILLATWEKIGHTEADLHRRKVETKLREAARDFASSKGFLKEVDEELGWMPDYSGNKAEWLNMQALHSPPILNNVPAETTSAMEEDEDSADNMPLPMEVDTDPYRAALQVSVGNLPPFSISMPAVMSERHIGLDPGRRNFGIVVVDKCIDGLPTILRAANYDLNLPTGVKANRIVVSLLKDTDLWSWMQQTEVPVLPLVDRVILHIEQTSNRNADWKALGVQLAKEMEERVGDVDSSCCIVELSQPNVHRAAGPMFRMGQEIVAALSLKAPTYRKSRKEAPSDIPSATVPSPAKKRKIVEVESSTDITPDEEESRESLTDEYHMKKVMSADIFRYIINADEKQQEAMKVVVHPDLQNSWQQKLSNSPNIKLDDVGDALLHALNDILCGGSNYRQILPANSSLHNNRTVVIAVLPSETFWVVIHSSWSLFKLEDFGSYPSVLKGQMYKSPATFNIIKKDLHPDLKTAMSNMAGGERFTPVDHIKIVVKQLQGLNILDLSGKEAGALTNTTVKVMKEICTESVGTNNKLCERNDKHVGSIYIQLNITTSQKFQVIRSSAKHTNTSVAFLDWMKGTVPEFLENLNHTMSQHQKLLFFEALQNLASSDKRQFGMLELSVLAKQKLIVDYGEICDEGKHLLADLSLIAINVNQQHIKSIAANYRQQPVRHASTLRSKKHQHAIDPANNTAKLLSSDAPDQHDITDCEQPSDDTSVRAEHHATDCEQANPIDPSSALVHIPSVEQICALNSEYLRLRIRALDFLKSSNLKIKFARSDGHCIMHAWSITTGSDMDFIKQSIITEYLLNRDRYAQFGVDEDDLQKYVDCNQFQLQSVDTVVNMLSNSLNITALILEETEQGVSTDFKIIRPYSRQSERTILLYRKGGHYDAIVADRS